MEERIARFIAALRGAGVRISIAESQDAWQAIACTGVTSQQLFRDALRATLIKDSAAFPAFDELFPLYFSPDTPPLLNPQADLTPGERQMLQQTLASLLAQLARDLRQLLDWLLNGRGPTQEDLQRLAEQAGMDASDGSPSPFQARRYARRMQQLLGWDQLQDLLEQLWELLAEQGMSPDAIEQLKEQMAGNQAALQQQLEDYAGQRTLERRAEAARRQPATDLLQRPFSALDSTDMRQLRDEVRRLANRLRSRAALRQKRGKQGKLDVKSTLRANLGYGGVPFEIRMKQRRRKPKLVVILDVSTSMRPVAEFFLRMLYELQDQVQKMRSFAFIDHLEDVTPDLTALRVDEAVREVLTRMPPGYYSTDLGYSLRQFEAEHLALIDHRTTFIVLGDARNNYNDPALDTFRTIGGRARKTIWMNPEYPAQWGTDDSDMLLYLPLCDEVYQVRNLEQLSAAIDRILI